ncbi:DUF4349 domain-containing protein [Clostridium formicaceticum]|uniref:Anti-sigma-W factor RsiW n=1 Tax=Clostridium formicaceticum TaxID=1497 RepID=A0AAC9RLD6_9CLOT|nr:DUF4349 domain-containing protein [Clostridium formicaceticum]AOY76708.1 hypothetical protein BJL90_13025 [Clostridium formicaceticum]ARE87143.1 hypothetical protein CLFO_15300 [Clostridium formicaceticum]
MDCKNIDNYISSYIDGCLTEREEDDFEKHINQCETCKAKYENLKMILDCVHEIEEVPLPKNFSAELGEKLREEAATSEVDINSKVDLKKKRLSKKWKFIGGIAAGLLIMMMSVTMLNNFSNKSADYLTTESADAGMGVMGFRNEEAPVAFDTGRDGTSVEAQEEMLNFKQKTLDDLAMASEMTTNAESFRKIIQRGRVALEVENFEEVHQKVLTLVESTKGYVQHNEVYYYSLNREYPEESLKNASMELKVPNHEFFSVFEALKTLGNVVEENTSAQDITESYMDIENQVKNLKIQEERLRDILQKAEKVEDLLRIENELNRIRTEINHFTGTLKNYDHLVAMSTISLNITQVKDGNMTLQSINEGLWSRGKNSFIHSINRMLALFERSLVAFLGLLPPLILMTILTGLGYFFCKKLVRKK